MLSVVFDTNIYISGIILSGKISKIIDFAKQKTFFLYISPDIYHELTEVSTKKFGFTTKDKQLLIRRIKTLTIMVHPTKVLHIIPNNHPDNQILSTCESCRADYLVTGDKQHLLPLKKFGHTKIITTSEFLDIIES
jgi:putative PIN family toxin of toxin-antitoxin system